jgi:hypothetical protein
MLLVWISRSAIPERLSAARTRSIRVAFWESAALAVAARVTTPAEMIATSGTRVASPSALMSSRVPLTGWVNVGACCAWAAAERDAALRASAASKACLIVLILLHIVTARRSPECNGC